MKKNKIMPSNYPVKIKHCIECGFFICKLKGDKYFRGFNWKCKKCSKLHNLNNNDNNIKTMEKLAGF